MADQSINNSGGDVKINCAQYNLGKRRLANTQINEWLSKQSMGVAICQNIILRAREKNLKEGLTARKLKSSILESGRISHLTINDKHKSIARVNNKNREKIHIWCKSLNRFAKGSLHPILEISIQTQFKLFKWRQ